MSPVIYQRESLPERVMKNHVTTETKQPLKKMRIQAALMVVLVGHVQLQKHKDLYLRNYKWQNQFGTNISALEKQVDVLPSKNQVFCCTLNLLIYCFSMDCKGVT